MWRYFSTDKVTCASNDFIDHLPDLSQFSGYVILQCLVGSTCRNVTLIWFTGAPPSAESCCGSQNCFLRRDRGQQSHRRAVLCHGPPGDPDPWFRRSRHQLLVAERLVSALGVDDLPILSLTDLEAISSSPPPG